MAKSAPAKKICITTFGGFNINYGEKNLSDIPTRRSKMWLVLKYLITNHKRTVPAEDLINILWQEEDCPDPSGSLQKIIYRLRKALTEFYGDAKLQCINLHQGRYSWKPTADFEIDTVRFEALVSEARTPSKAENERTALYLKAIALYNGDFLRGESNDPWLTNFVNYYKRLYFNSVYELADLYESRSMYEEAVSVYNEAFKVEPHEESFYERQIRLLIDLGEYVRAKQQYNRIEHILKDEFDAKPGINLENLLHEMSRDNERQAAQAQDFTDLNDIKHQFENISERKTAIFCGPETFKRIYAYDRYLDERMQFPVFLVMLSIQSPSLEKGAAKMRPMMKTLRHIVLQTLRQCDIVCQFSSNQFLLMLTATNDKNKMAPLVRIQKLFEKEAIADGSKLHMQATAMREHINV
ncbi:MAG: winged helix-turn-helix domain-containing protein [Defluviitaleaceae bacterium]|nr:winged helix-turn-helix domain-containing protein [Defluviitaleaceae bacterium]